mgnify:CR=1 FL=1
MVQPKAPSNPGRRKFLINATSIVGAGAVAGAIVPFVGSWNPSARAEAAGAPVKADLSKLLPGEMMIVEWRGVPVYVVKHTQESMAVLNENLSRLSDPDSVEDQQPDYARNELRSRKKGISIITAVCTHLACAPKFYPQLGTTDFDSDWQGGVFCPCHGSKFDLAGRVYAGVPAPTNLPIPPHYFKTEDILIIGEDGGTV